MTITREQRAELVANIRYNPFGVDADAAADQLEADGETIARLTAERDAADNAARLAINASQRKEFVIQDAHEAQLVAEARVKVLEDALADLHHAVCGDTGFAAAVRHFSRLGYPWPALDKADAIARAALNKGAADAGK